MHLKRLLRTESILGLEAIEKLQNSTVLLVGLGGVGGYALESLARSGIGSFILIDSDRFDETNLNRQILCLQSNIGKLKTDIAKERILSIDSNIQIQTYPVFLDETNIDYFLEMKPNIVIDAIDSVTSKCKLLQKCVEKNIPVVSSMGAALKKSPILIRTADISQTSGDAIAKLVRTNLRKIGITNGIECVYSTEAPCKQDNKVLGSLASVVGTFGLTLAQCAINRIIQ